MRGGVCEGRVVGGEGCGRGGVCEGRVVGGEGWCCERVQKMGNI